MELVGNLWFLNEYEELEDVKPRDELKLSVVALGSGVVLILFFLAIFLMLTGENGFVCCFPPGGGIWA